jgi:glycosyltransferase involved in cell wall biosynthesis
MEHAAVADSMERSRRAGASPLRERPEPVPREARALAGRPLRVAMLASVFPPSIGGIQSHTLRLGQKLVSRGVEVHVVTRIQPGLSPFERMAGVRVHRVGLAAARGAAGSAAFIADALLALSWLRKEVDVLHAHQLLSPATIGLLAAPLAGLPLVVNPHACGSIGDVGVLSGTRVGRLRLRAAVKRADAFVAVSRTIRDELVAAGAPPEAIWSITNGVDTDRFCPVAAGERRMVRRALGFDDGPLVVFAGRFAPEKGVDVLLDAWPRLVARVPGARLCLMGSGGEEARLRQQAHVLRVEGSVMFTGGVTDVAPYVRVADVAVLPSRSEGMPVALLEAMSCAIPVVATRVGGSAEVLDDGVTGRLVPAESPEALAAGLSEALLERAPAARRAEAARAHVLAHHAMDVVADDFVSLYEALTGRSGAGRSLPVTVDLAAR